LRLRPWAVGGQIMWLTVVLEMDWRTENKEREAESSGMNGELPSITFMIQGYTIAKRLRFGQLKGVLN